ncbi:hypothetical protein OG426_53470 [Streptomyces canus]|nr:hypothetical protein [Streptomyces canus]MCX4853927.1 hypothetical protein [Streptomyces canus]WSW41307.1 hypothetical protein OG426_53470 [Streptomyces canus]
MQSAVNAIDEKRAIAHQQMSGVSRPLVLRGLVGDNPRQFVLLDMFPWLRKARQERIKSSWNTARYTSVVVVLVWPSKRAAIWTGSPPATASVAMIVRKSCGVKCRGSPAWSGGGSSGQGVVEQLVERVRADDVAFPADPVLEDVRQRRPGDQLVVDVARDERDRAGVVPTKPGDHGGEDAGELGADQQEPFPVFLSTG